MSAVILWVLFLISVAFEPRSLINPFLIILALLSTYFSIGSYIHENNIYYLEEAFVILTFVLIPFIAIIIGLFLIINGIIVLKKEGKSLTNILSLLSE